MAFEVVYRAAAAEAPAAAEDGPVRHEEADRLVGVRGVIWAIFKILTVFGSQSSGVRLVFVSVNGLA